jgi:surfeit locus 1 family protein
MKYRYQFTPTLIPTIATIILLFILLSLGHWQLNRAKQNRELIQNYTERNVMQPLSETVLNNPTQNLNFYTIELHGQYDNQHTILLDNKMYHEQVGYQVLTPLLLNNRKAILINRGWISQGISREQLPIIPTASGNQAVIGIVRSPEKSFTLGPNETSLTWPLLMQKIDLNELQQKTGEDFYPYIIELKPDQANGFTRDWSPVFYVTPQRNIAYAFQWFALALTVIIIYISVNLHRDLKKSM